MQLSIKALKLHKIEIPAEWANIKVVKAKDTRDIPDFIRDVMEPINAMKGDDLPVSAFRRQRRRNIPIRNFSLRKTRYCS